MSLSFASLGHPWDQAGVGQGAAACPRLWWTPGPDGHLVPLFQTTAASEEPEFAALFLHAIWKMKSFAGGLLPSVHPGSPRDLSDCWPKAWKKSSYSYWTMPTQISKDHSLNSGYRRSAVNTTAGSGLISIIVQKPSSNMRLRGALWPLQKNQCC